MIAKTTSSLIAKLVVVLALLGCASLLATGAADGAVVSAHATPTETLSTYEQQLAAGEIAKAVINVKGRDVHATLSNGKLVIVHYPSGHETAVLEALKAKGITPVNGKGAVVKPPKAHKHKIRYIVAGVVIILIIIVAAILLIRRRRAAAEY